MSGVILYLMKWSSSEDGVWFDMRLGDIDVRLSQFQSNSSSMTRIISCSAHLYGQLSQIFPSVVYHLGDV